MDHHANTQDLPAPTNAESDEIVEAVETTFGLERDLQAGVAEEYCIA